MLPDSVEAALATPAHAISRTGHALSQEQGTDLYHDRVWHESLSKSIADQPVVERDEIVANAYKRSERLASTIRNQSNQKLYAIMVEESLELGRHGVDAESLVSSPLVPRYIESTLRCAQAAETQHNAIQLEMRIYHLLATLYFPKQLGANQFGDAWAQFPRIFPTDPAFYEAWAAEPAGRQGQLDRIVDWGIEHNPDIESQLRGFLRLAFINNCRADYLVRADRIQAWHV